MLVGAEAADGLAAHHAEVRAARAAHVVAARVALDGGAAARAADAVRLIRAEVLLGGGVAALVGALPALVQLARRRVLRAVACFNVAIYASPVLTDGTDEDGTTLVDFYNARAAVAVSRWARAYHTSGIFADVVPSLQHKVANHVWLI